MAEKLKPEEILKAIDKAHEVINDLCHQRRRWIMSIPADVERDPDLMIGQALMMATEFIQNTRPSLTEAEAREIVKPYSKTLRMFPPQQMLYEDDVITLLMHNSRPDRLEKKCRWETRGGCSYIFFTSCGIQPQMLETIPLNEQATFCSNCGGRIVLDEAQSQTTKG